MFASVAELEAGSSDEVGDGSCDEYFPPGAECRDARSDVHGHAADIVAT